MSEGNAHSDAYPTGDHGSVWGGLTKRELFAAMAMQGMHASGLATASCESNLPLLMDHVAKYAVNQADALLTALDKAEDRS